jgi:cytoskeleton protein RodZ
MTDQQTMHAFDPGERLKSARRARGLTRSDVAARLRCTEAVVAALEAGEPSGLAPVYERGFLRAYARVLKLPAAETARLLESSGEIGTEVRPVFPASASGHAADRWLRAASYALASLLVGTLAWQVAHEVVRLSQTDQAATGEPAPESASESGKHVNASIAALDRWKQDLGARSAAGTQAWQALEGGRTDLADGEYLLGINTSADSWVEIRDVGGNILEQDLLRGGASREYRGFGPFKITLGRTSAVEFWINGQAVDLAPFARDDVTQMLLDPQSLSPTLERVRATD